MTSSKSLPSVEEVLEQLPNTVSTYRDADTKRRRYSVQGTSSKRSRSNKTCSICGNPKAGRGAMCKDCYTRVRAVKVTLTCAWCGKEFDRPLYVHEKALKRGMKDAYCCKECAQAHHAVKNAKTCKRCGKAMPGQRGERYCSVECKIAARVAAKKILPARTCPWCGTIFTPKMSKAQHCSRNCADAAHSERMRGKGNSNYKTGTSYAKWYAETRPLIMERDEHRCVVCQGVEHTAVVTWKGQQVSRTNLTIHHINEDPADNAPENLVTLCKTCHAVHHKSAQTPWPWLSVYAQAKSQSMTSKWRNAITSLRRMYSPTTVSSSMTP